MTDAVESEFTEFVAARGHALVRVAYALTGDVHTAHDMVQSALAKAFARWRQIKTTPDWYIRRTIYHEHISNWRRVRRYELPTATPPERATPGDLAETTVRHLALRDALQALPPRQRAVVVLRYLEDLSISETAEILGCREGTVASQASRALAKLRNLVRELDWETT